MKPASRLSIKNRLAADAKPRTTVPAGLAGGIDRGALLIGGVLIVTALVYLRSLGNGFVFDDHTLIVTNHGLSNSSFLWQALFHDEYWFSDPLHLPVSSRYRPMQLWWVWLNYNLFGLNAAGWHAAMVGLHLVAVYLVYKVALRLTASSEAAIVAASIFALHPIQTEAVAWVAAGGVTLAAVFELAAIYLLIRRDRAPLPELILAMLFFAGALLSHEVAAFFPALIFAYAFFLESSEDQLWPRLRTAIVRSAAFWVELIFYLIVRYQVLGFINRTHQLNHASNAEVLLTVPRVIVTDLLLLAAPWFFDPPPHRALFVATAADPAFLVPAAALAALGAIFYLLVRNDSRRRLYLFCAAWMGIAIAPVMNLRALRPDQIVQDNYLYLPAVALCVMAGDLAIRFARRSTQTRQIAIGAAAILLASYVVALWSAEGFWRDDFTLFSQVVEQFPECSACHDNLGGHYLEHGDLASAEREFSQSVEFEPDNDRAVYNLGFVHMQMGRNREAASEIAQALKLVPRSDPFAYALLAQVLDSTGDQAGSEATLEHAASLPDGVKAVALARAQIKMAHGDPSGAEAVLLPLEARDPENRDFRVWLTLGGALAAQKRNQDALAAYEKAIALAPDRPVTYYSAAQMLHALGRDQEAMEQLNRGLELRPNDSHARALIDQIRAGQH